MWIFLDGSIITKPLHSFVALSVSIILFSYQILRNNFIIVPIIFQFNCWQLYIQIYHSLMTHLPCMYSVECINNLPCPAVPPISTTHLPASKLHPNASNLLKTRSFQSLLKAWLQNKITQAPLVDFTDTELQSVFSECSGDYMELVNSI